MSKENYKNELLRRKLSKETIYLYMTGLKLVERFLGKSIDEATKEDIGRFLDNINHCESNTIITRLMAIKLYFKWLGKSEIADFPFPKNKGNKLISTDLLTEEDMTKLLNVCDKPRDKAFLSLLFDSACRRSEIMNLNIEDLVIESDKTGYIVVNGKTGKRQVPLSFSIPALRNWINFHPFRDNPKAPLFIALAFNYGHRMSDTTIFSFLRKYTRKSKINKRVFCHLFRHSRLTDLDKKGLSHTAMKYYAGWSRNSNMPSVYSHFSAQDTKELVYEADGIAQPKVRKKTILEPVNCPKCETPNDKTNKYCYLCGMPLDENSRKEFEVEEVVKELIKTDPELNRMLSDKLKGIIIRK